MIALFTALLNAITAAANALTQKLRNDAIYGPLDSSCASPRRSTTSRTRSIACAIAVMLLPLSAPPGCASASSRDKASMRVYQSPVLRLAAGQPVQTRDGVYVPQVDETWHSDADFRELEHELLDAVAAYQQLRLRTGPQPVNAEGDK